VDIVTIGLRIAHIVAGVLWVGGAALFFFYVEPATKVLGLDAEKFMSELMVRRRVPIYFFLVSTITVVGGAGLYWQDSSGLSSSWITSPTGLGLTLGAVAALLAWVGGSLLIPRTLTRLGAIGAEMKAAGAAASPELIGRLHGAQEQLRVIGLADIVLLAISVVGMAVARELS
jgi:uncharacterized membrane protein